MGINFILEVLTLYLLCIQKLTNAQAFGHLLKYLQNISIRHMMDAPKLHAWKKLEEEV